MDVDIEDTKEDLIILPTDVKVREDLKKYFKLLSQEDKSLACKLAGMNGCKVNGIHSVFKYNKTRGWYSFERHLIRIHKIPKELFLKGPKLGQYCADIDHNKVTLQDFLPSFAETNQNCFVCLSRFETNSADVNFDTQIKELFPGCVGSIVLGQQLFCTFFLRKILKLPKKKCEKFLKHCSESNMSGMWFNLCNICKQTIVDGIVIHNQLLSLESQLNRIKKSVENKINDSFTENVFPVELSSMENEIRKCICDGGNYDNHNKSNEQPSGVKIEYIDTQCAEQFDDDFDFNNYEDSHVPSLKQSKNCSLPSYDDDDDDTINSKSKRQTDMDFEDPDFLPSDLEYEKKILLKPSSPYTPGFASRSKIKKEKTRNKMTNLNQVEKNEKHENWDAAAKAFKCKLCPSSYPNETLFTRHLWQHEESKKRNNQFDCDKCGYPCTNVKSRTNHKSRNHKPDKSLYKVNCNLCSFQTSSKTELGRHMKEHKEISQKERIGGKFHCKLCDRLFLSYELLCKHKRLIHHKEIGWEPITCELCQKIFSTQRQLQDHDLQVHKKQSRFHCDRCGRGFMSNAKLRRHMITHQDTRSFICDLCGADFHYGQSLKDHLKKCHPESVNGEQSNNGATAVVEHHACKYCDLEFVSKTLLIRHVKEHTEIYRYKCEECDRCYPTLHNLRRHIEINHSSNEVFCPYCDRKFPHQENVRGHLKFCNSNPNKNPEINKVYGEPIHDIRLPNATPQYSTANDAIVDKSEPSSAVIDIKAITLTKEEASV